MEQRYNEAMVNTRFINPAIQVGVCLVHWAVGVYALLYGMMNTADFVWYGPPLFVVGMILIISCTRWFEVTFWNPNMPGASDG